MKNKVLSNSIIYTICGLLLKCFSFFLIPLYTRYLTTNDYGITSITNSFIATMSIFLVFSLFSAVLRFYVDLRENPEKLRRFYGTIVSFVFISGAVFFLIFFLIRDFLSEHIFSGIEFYPIIFISIISLIFYCQHSVYENILKSQQKALKYSLTAIAYFFINLFLNILFVVVLKKGAVGVIIATMLANIMYTIYFIVDLACNKAIRFCLDWALLKDALKYSIPIMPHDLSTKIATLVSNILIGGNFSFSVLGIYSIASQFGNIVDTVQVYINNAYGPWLYEKLHDKTSGYKKDINKTIKLLSDVIGLFLLGVALFAQDYIVLFLDKSYADAWKYVPAVVMVFAIKIPYYFYVNILFYYKEASRLLFIATFSGSVLNIFLSFLLIPEVGVFGSILADAVAMVIRVMIIIFISRKYENTGICINIFFRNFIKIALFIFCGLVFSYWKFSNSFNILNFVYKILIVGFYLTILYLQNKKEFVGFKKLLKLKK